MRDTRRSPVSLNINTLAFLIDTGSSLLMLVVYWVVGGIYTILDITNRPAALRRYKIQPGTNEPVDKRKLCKVIGQVLFNQIIVGFPVIYLSYYIMEWRGFPPVRELPTFHWVLAEIAIHILCEEIGFYYSHRYIRLRRLEITIACCRHQFAATDSYFADSSIRVSCTSTYISSITSGLRP